MSTISTNNPYVNRREVVQFGDAIAIKMIANIKAGLASQAMQSDPSYVQVVRQHVGQVELVRLDRALQDLDARTPRLLNRSAVSGSILNMAGPATAAAQVDLIIQQHARKLVGLLKAELVLPRDQQTTPNLTEVRLRLNKVLCVDETNPEGFGSDEIAIGGSAIDTMGNTVKVSRFNIDGSNGKFYPFDDNDARNFNPPHTFAILQGGDSTYPKTFSAAVALAEVDGGGFADFLSELYKSVQKEVTAVLTAAGATIGTAIGGPVGALIGAVVAYAAGKLIALLIEAFKDDVFPVVNPLTITLPSADATFANGSLTSAPESRDYLGYGGRYRVTFSWELVKQ